MAETVLQVSKRDAVGKKEVKRLRRLGRLPGVFYIHGEEPVPVSMEEKQLRDVLHVETNVVDLHFVDDDTKTKCVIREVQWDPVYDSPLHVDLMGIKLTEKISVSVPIHLIGTPVGVSQNGGVLQHILREIELEGLPLEIPEHIEVDVSGLDVGDAVRIEDLSLDKVEILGEPNWSIAVVRPPTVIAEEPEVEEEVEEGAEPELVGREKDEEEEEESEEES